MRIEGVPNKFEIFQDFYLETNGEQISYDDAKRLFYQMDNVQRTEFETFYKDETGYEVIDATGYDIEGNVELQADPSDPNKLLKVDGKYVSNLSNINSHYISQKYSIQAYAAKSGKILDPIWSGYSAEEIIQMQQNGVNIPQDIIDIANTIMQSQGANLENSTEVDEGNAEEVTEKETYLELIPKAKNKIEKCNENNEKLSAEIDKLIPETQNQQRNFQDKIKDQKKALENYENQLREWRSLQDKVNNGEALTDTEAQRYAELTGMLEDKNGQNSDEMIFDKNEIAKSLNQINILAVLGEDLADETIYIGDMLADYTSDSNYKRTYQTVSQKLGFIGSILSMAEGKTLAKETNKVGNDTQEYSGETINSVKNIASIAGVENSVLSSTELQSTQTTDKTDTQTDTQKEQKTAPVNNENEQEQAAVAQTNDTEKEDFIITDDSVLELIDESGNINVDLLKQFKNANESTKNAKRDKKTTETADKKISKLVKEYHEQEEKSQEEIKAKEEEKKKIKKELEKLTGKSSEEIDKELESHNSNNSSEKEMDEPLKNEIRKRKQLITDNNAEIANIKTESEKAVQAFSNKTKKEQAFIDKAIPEENKALETNSKYQEETLPQHKERLDFTDNSGNTLTKMGKYRVTVGMEQIARLLIRKGTKNVVKGAISMEIGLTARIISNTPMPKITEKSTKTAVNEGGDAVGALTSLNTKIISVTGEDTSSSSSNSSSTNVANGQNNPTSQQSGETTQGTAPAKDMGQTELADSTPAVTEQSNGSPQTGGAAPVDSVSIQANDGTPANGTSQNSTPSASVTKKEEDDAVENAAQPNSAMSVTNSKSDEPEKQAEDETEKADEKTADKSQKEVDEIDSSANKDAKDSKDIKKDTEKTKKELEKDAKKLQKEIQQDQKEAEQLTKESEEATKKQEEMLTEYETLVMENETLAAEDASKQQNSQPKNNNSQGNMLGSSAFSIGTQSGSDNSDRITSNNERLNVLSSEFQIAGNTITRNNTKLVTIEKNVNKKYQKFQKTNKAIAKKVKQEQKDEEQKKDKLQVQLGAVGIAENVFSITTSTGVIMNKIGTGMIASGTAMLSNPFTAAAGAALISTGTPIQTTGITLTTVGTYGTVACGVTKAAINIANGNLAAGLMSLGQTAISAVSTLSGTQSAVSSTLTAVSAGMNIVSSGASMVNNVRAVQGKEASGVFSKISTIAGAASSLTTSASTIADLGKTGATAFGKSMQIAGVAGSALSTTSQLMTEFGAEGNAANILGMIGGAVSTISAVGQLAAKKTDNKSENEKEDKTEDKKETDKKDSTEKTSKEERREQKQQEKEELKEAKAARKAQKEASKGLDKELKENMRENGASKEYADIDDATLDKELAAAQAAGNSDQVAKLSAEKQQRTDYKDKMAKIEAASERKQKNISNIITAVSAGANAGSQYLGMTQSKAQVVPKKKAAPPGRLTQRTKNIMQKNRKRIAALRAMR